MKLTWHLKMDGWNTSFLLGSPIFRCYVSFRECIYLLKFQSHPPTMSGCSPRWFDVIKFCWIPLEVDSGTFFENPPLPFFFIGREACKSQNEVVVSNMFLFSPRKLEKMNPILTTIFSDMLVQPPTRKSLEPPKARWWNFNFFCVHPNPLEALAKKNPKP